MKSYQKLAFVFIVALILISVFSGCNVQPEKKEEEINLTAKQQAIADAIFDARKLWKEKDGISCKGLAFRECEGEIFLSAQYYENKSKPDANSFAAAVVYSKYFQLTENKVSKDLSKQITTIDVWGKDKARIALSGSETDDELMKKIEKLAASY